MEDLSLMKSSNVGVMYPEAWKRADDVILARCYLKGQIEYVDGSAG